jgi:hypothetical protein
MAGEQPTIEQRKAIATTAARQARQAAVHPDAGVRGMVSILHGVINAQLDKIVGESNGS